MTANSHDRFLSGRNERNQWYKRLWRVVRKPYDFWNGLDVFDQAVIVWVSFVVVVLFGAGVVSTLLLQWLL